MKLWPETVEREELPELIDGSQSLWLVPAFAQLSMERVNIRAMLLDETGEVDQYGDRVVPPISATRWAELGQDFNTYREIEREVHAGRSWNLTPVIVVRMPSGALVWQDGYHRISIALAAGVHELWAYVYELPTALAVAR